MQPDFEDSRQFETGKIGEGEGYIDIPDEEIDSVLKGFLQDCLQNEKLFMKHRNDFLDAFEKELQEYAEEQFFKQGRGEII